MDKPDTIWAWPDDVIDNLMAACRVGEAGIPEEYPPTEYLLATPERELASELAEALREIYLVPSRDACGQVHEDQAERYVDEMEAIARAVLAKLEGKG